MPRLGTGKEELVDIESGICSMLSHSWSRKIKAIYEEHGFIFGSLLLVAVALFLITQRKSTIVKSECSTPECISSSVRQRMDFHVDPCNDFYSFACGGFVAQNEISDGKLVLNFATEIKEKIEEQLRAMLSETIHQNDLSSFNLAKKLYQQCVIADSHLIESFRNIIARFGNWPIAQKDLWNLIASIFDWLISRDRWENALDENWPRIIAEFRKVGYETNSILSVHIVDHPKQQSKRIILIGPPKLLVEGQNTIEYFNRMMEVAIINGVDPVRARIELERSLEFEMKLARIAMQTDPGESILADMGEYNLFSLRDLEERYPYIHWVDCINALLPSAMTVDCDEVVLVLQLPYFSALEDLLNDTPPHVIKTYLIWRAIWGQLKQIPVVKVEKEQRCAQMAGDSLTIVVSAMYVREHFNQSTRKAISEMVRAIRHELESILIKSNWMDEGTRERSVKKLEEMFVNIGYPDYLMNDSEVEEFYNDSKVDESSFLSTILSINKFNTDQMFVKLREPKRRNDWSFEQQTFRANAAYLRIENGLQFPAAILQGNFFSPERPSYMNFGTMGSIIGHEFTHGFDNMGKQLVYSGLFATEELRTEKIVSLREKCLMDQYGNFTEPLTGRKVNGRQTLRENIADNGGFKLSYLAYQNWERENGVEPKLPGLNYTSQQMFWISLAQMHCSIAKRKYMDFVMEDVHSPARFRIIHQ